MPTAQITAHSSGLLQEVADAVGKAKKIVVVTGAGISTNSGIPDFRSERGLYALIQAQFEAAAVTTGDDSIDSSIGNIDGNDNGNDHEETNEVEGEEDSVDQNERPTKRRRISTSSTPTSRESTDVPSSSLPLSSPLPLSSCLSDDALEEASRSSDPSSSSSSVSSPSSSSPSLSDSRSASPPASKIQSQSQPQLLPKPQLQSQSQPQSQPQSRLYNMKGRDLFDVAIWSDPVKTSVFYKFTTSLRQKIKEVQPTTTHHFIAHLKHVGKLARVYTQNIDEMEKRIGLSTDLPPSKSTSNRNITKRHRPDCVFLHGSLDALRCFACARLADWDQSDRHNSTRNGHQPDCPHCQGATQARQSRGKRALGVGKLRPNIVLYGEEHPCSDLISPIVQHDLTSGPDLLLILGTSLRVHGLKVMVREFAKAVHRKSGGRVVFVNLTKPCESVWGNMIDYWVEWDCDAWVDDLQKRRPSLWMNEDEAVEWERAQRAKRRSVAAEEKKMLRRRETIAVPENERRVVKNPMADRMDHKCAAYCMITIAEAFCKIRGARFDFFGCGERNVEERGTGDEKDKDKKRVGEPNKKRARKSAPAALGGGLEAQKEMEMDKEQEKGKEEEKEKQNKMTMEMITEAEKKSDPSTTTPSTATTQNPASKRKALPDFPIPTSNKPKTTAARIKSRGARNSADCHSSATTERASQLSKIESAALPALRPEYPLSVVSVVAAMETSEHEEQPLTSVPKSIDSDLSTPIEIQQPPFPQPDISVAASPPASPLRSPEASIGFTIKRHPRLRKPTPKVLANVTTTTTYSASRRSQSRPATPASTASNPLSRATIPSEPSPPPPLQTPLPPPSPIEPHLTIEPVSPLASHPPRALHPHSPEERRKEWGRRALSLGNPLMGLRYEPVGLGTRSLTYPVLPPLAVTVARAKLPFMRDGKGKVEG